MGSSEGTISAPDDPEELGPGDVLGERYRIVGTLGTGGIGAVYRAAQLPLARPVAIKVLHDDYLSFDELRARFEREARVLSALTHPHVVSISDYGIDGERPYLVMELLEGRTLEEVVRLDPMDPARALDLIRQILEGLAFAHHKGVAHRDLKPANIFLQRLRDGSEHVKLLDFGLARMVSTDDDEANIDLTKRGVVFGTPAYMSPEQAAGTPADVRSDVYTAGLLLFELLTGRRPFIGETRAELLRAHLTDLVPRLASVRPRLRAQTDLVELLDLATAKDPTERFADAGELLEAFDAIDGDLAWLVGEHEVSSATTQISTKRTLPPVVRPPEPKARAGMIAGALAAVLLVGLGLAWGRDDSPTPPTSGVATSEAEEAETPDQETGGRDPWREPPPEPLRPFLEMVEQGHVFEERREIVALYALASAMPEDPRPLLLLGHLFVARGWYSDAIERYERAYRLDPTVRGDPRMLASLIELTARESVGERAAEVVELIYGAEALDALDAAVDERADDPLAQLRLVQLRDRIRESP